MTVPTFIRAKIFEKIEKGIHYPQIIEWVKSQGYSISKGGITYIKDNYKKGLDEEETEQKKIKSEQKNEQLNETKQSNKTEETSEKTEVKSPEIKTKSNFNLKFSEAFWIAWDDILPSLESVFRQSKWKSKFNMVQILKNEIEKVRAKK